MQTLNSNHNDRINEIHDKYLNTISPFIMQIEVLDGEYPVEILNEIRAVFGHLSKSHLSDDAAIVERNLSKADSHIKRAIMDCYKYLCFAYDNKYEEFSSNFKNVDLSEIDNGDFLPILCKKRKFAIERLISAKRQELTVASDDVLYDSFEDAYNSYADVYNFISGSFEKLERLRQKTTKRDAKSKRQFWIGALVGIAGLAVGIIGVIIAILA